MSERNAASDGRRHARPPTSARALALAALGIAGVLLGLATPRLVAAIIAIPADRVAAHIRSAEKVTDAALEALLVAQHAAFCWHATGEAWRVVAAVELELVRRGHDSSHLARAEQAVIRSLALAPVDPHSWARHAEIASLRKDAESAATAIQASIETGWYEPRLLKWRARQIVRIWDQADMCGRALFANHLRRLTFHAPEALANLQQDPETARLLSQILHHREERTGSIDHRRQPSCSHPDPRVGIEF